jgi:hypothetical protein
MQLSLPLAGSWCALVLLSAAAQAQDAPTITQSGELAVYTDSDHVNVFTPAAKLGLSNQAAGWSVNARYAADIVSAASVDIVATASRPFHEVRHGVSADGQLRHGDLGFGADAALSVEPDYLSISGGARGTLALAQAGALLALGYTFAHDTAGRTGTPFRVFHQDVARHALTAGASIVLDRSSLLWLGLDVFVELGDSSKPYRYVPMFDAADAKRLPNGASVEQVNQLRLPERPREQLPAARDRYAVTLRYTRRASSLSLRAEERVYLDDWSMLASTTDLRCALDLSRALELALSVRLHAQSGTSFWQRAYVASENAGGIVLPSLRTGDRELGPLWTATVGADLRYGLGAAYGSYEQALVLRVAMMRTRFLDALFIEERLALLASLSISGWFR